jgi:hypothetical protein
MQACIFSFTGWKDISHILRWKFKKKIIILIFFCACTFNLLVRGLGPLKNKTFTTLQPCFITKLHAMNDINENDITLTHDTLMEL